MIYTISMFFYVSVNVIRTTHFFDHTINLQPLNFLKTKGLKIAVFASDTIAGDIYAILVIVIFVTKLWFTKARVILYAANDGL